MTDDEVKVMDAVRRMTDMMTVKNDVFKDNVKAIEFKNAILADLAILTTAGADKISARGFRLNATADKTDADDVLEKLLRKMASTAKIIKKSDPAFNNTFIMRRGFYGSQELLDTARAFKEDLTTAVIAKFDDFALPSATPVNIQAKIDASEAARTQQNEGKGDTVASTAEVKAAIKRLRANRMSLKEIGENILDELGDEGLIGEWKAACKIEKRAKNEPPPTPPNNG